MAGGRIVRSGDKDLALELEEQGYANLGQEVTPDRSASVGATP
jgi:Fe-S cluster assembly ATPase SufC